MKKKYNKEILQYTAFMWYNRYRVFPIEYFNTN